MPTASATEYEIEFDRRWDALAQARAQEKAAPSGRRFREFPSHLLFGYHGNAAEYCLFGWHPPEHDFVWTSYSEAVLHLPPFPREEAYLLNMRIAPFIAGPIRRQRVSLTVGGELVAEWSVSHPGHYFALLFDRHLAVSQDLIFHLPDGSSPKALGLNDDDRQLAIQFFSIWLSPWQGISI
jgi:hypothetical protein